MTTFTKAKLFNELLKVTRTDTKQSHDQVVMMLESMPGATKKEFWKSLCDKWGVDPESPVRWNY